MSNWYKKANSMYDTHDRFYYNVLFAIWVPQGSDQETGSQVLTDRLKKATENIPMRTPGIDVLVSVEDIEKV